MNPILQEHFDEYALVHDAMDVQIACTPNAADGMTLAEFKVVITECGADFLVALTRYERVASTYMKQWLFELEPPDEALQFHELTYEMFQLRGLAIHRLQDQTDAVMEDPLLFLM